MSDDIGLRREAAAGWLDRLAQTLAGRDFNGIRQLVHPDGYWRDLLTFGWSFWNAHRPDAIAVRLAEGFEGNPASAFRLEGEPFAGMLGEHASTIEFFFAFDTPIAHGRGFARLVPDAADASDSGAPKACTVLTAMRELKAYPESIGRHRTRYATEALAGTTSDFDPAQDNPDVVVIGGGQSGLMAAARLQQLGVRTLVVDRSARLGDVWRRRYRGLKLHNELCMNHFPYMPFPENWPAYIPKDQVADWLEVYATCMGLHVAMGTEFLGGDYDDEAGRWTVRLRRPDGTLRELKPSHLVMALGVSGLPNIPRIEGLDQFRGAVFHSSGESDALEVEGRSVLVVGVGTSAHDIAQSMHERGAEVTMLQRSAITVVSLEPSSTRPYELYRRNEGVRPIADTDLMAASVPYSYLRRLHGPLSRQMTEADKPLLDGLRRAGFLLDNDDDLGGYFIKLLQTQSGYYLNVGGSELIIEGKVKLKVSSGIARVTEDSVVFDDGSTLRTDVIALATGYQPLQEAVRALLGDAVADRVGPIWGIGDDNELQAMYARTAQPGFHVIGGGFAGARAYSAYTAMLIKAEITGLLERQRLTAA